MGEPWNSPVNRLWAKAGCPHCGGSGYNKHGDICDCLYDQLTYKSDYIRLSDGDIDVLPAED